MQRTVLIVIATAIVAAGIAAGATFLLTDDDNAAIATLSPSATEIPLGTFTSTSSPSVTGASTAPAPAPGSTASPGGGATASAAGSSSHPPIRAASSVNCTSEPKFCSGSDSLHVVDKQVHASAHGSPPDYSGRPKIVMTSEIRKKDKSKASVGDEIGSIHVSVSVQNATSKTFVFAKREVALDIYRNGHVYDTLVTTGAGFNLTPGGKMTATFDRPITTDGEYSWQAKIWYYEK